MGTKNNPGKFDCFVKAEDDEPIFTLRGKDPLAGATVRHWVALRRQAALEKLGEAERIEEALQCAAAMDEYYDTKIAVK